ncbi:MULTISPECIES: hypothetical protein [Ehrlichia]|uniref:Uncharacterized protein n=1 Tax=Ehrlichia cf. muris str. EmCRT TaxID=1359167 RepID=A0A0F3NCY0_9RICK|nr:MULTISPECIES: hypothetical protein [Ehrlichia]KJV65591.1 hypothetical protein EMUCRT_0536 [Ehrlichia cf. muris str. EmCRT]OUC04461.1 hypothetical protein DB91_02745 [Ehrlichia sp. Wisconsin_h]
MKNKACLSVLLSIIVILMITDVILIVYRRMKMIGACGISSQGMSNEFSVKFEQSDQFYRRVTNVMDNFYTQLKHLNRLYHNDTYIAYGMHCVTGAIILASKINIYQGHLKFSEYEKCQLTKLGILQELGYKCDEDIVCNIYYLIKCASYAIDLKMYRVEGEVGGVESIRLASKIFESGMQDIKVPAKTTDITVGK